MIPLLKDWEDALLWRYVCAMFDLRNQYGKDSYEYWEQSLVISKKYESDYMRLQSEQLLTAREEVLEAARNPWPLERATSAENEAQAA